jgi:hypothetical protein
LPSSYIGQKFTGPILQFTIPGIKFTAIRFHSVAGRRTFVSSYIVKPQNFKIMKTIILATALAVSTSLTMAQKEMKNADTEKNNVEVAMLQPDNNKVQVLLNKTPGDPVRIKVYEDNKLLYTRRIKKEGSANITYDISAFPEGDYEFRIEQEKEVVYAVKVRKDANAQSAIALADSK